MFALTGRCCLRQLRPASIRLQERNIISTPKTILGRNNPQWLSPRPSQWYVNSPQRTVRFNSTSSYKSRLNKEGLELPIDNSEVAQIIARAEKVWPAPPRIPPGWSSTWSQWPYLLTFYWLSPYFLMLPQIEMLLNIQHAIPGEARPLLFSNKLGAFVFTIVPGEWAAESGGGFYVFKGLQEAGGLGELWKFEGVQSEEELVQAMEDDPELVSTSLVKVPVNPEGEAALARILARDDSVVELLSERFLDYVPEATHEWEESSVAEGFGSGEEVEADGDQGVNAPEDEEDWLTNPEEEIKALEELAKDLEAKLGDSLSPEEKAELYAEAHEATEGLKPHDRR